MPSVIKALLVLILTLLWGCALPVPPGEELNDFVPPEELMLAELAKQAMWYFGQSRYVDAELKFRQVLWLRPDLKNIKQNLAETLGREGLYEEAIQLYFELVREDSQTVAQLSGLARLYYAAGKFELARLQYEKALAAAIDMNDLGLMANMARSLAVLNFKVGDEEEAYCYSAQAFMWRPSQDEFLRHIYLFTAVGHYSAALNALKKYAMDNELERDPVFLHRRAVLSFGLGKFKDAYDLEVIAQEAAIGKNVDPAMLFEMNVVKVMAQRAQPDVALETGNDAEDENKQGEEFLEAPKTFALTNQAYTIYWPANLVQMVQELLTGKEAGE